MYIGLLIPTKYIKLIGFVPIFMGLKLGYEVYLERQKYKNIINHESEKNDNEIEIEEFLPILEIFENENENNEIEEKNENNNNFKELNETTFLSKILKYFFKDILNIQTIEVTTLCLANGGNNFIIYFPLFSSSNFFQIIIILIIFYIFLFIELFFTNLCIHENKISKILEKYGKIIVPFFLIFLGIYVLYGCVFWPN